MTNTSPDVEQLLALARDKTVASRQTLVETVSDLFFANEGVLSDRERALMTDILRQLIHDVEMSVRKALSERFSAQDGAPHDLVLALANDDIEVAHPILTDSQILQDIDLIEIIHHRTLEHQLAIAIRKNLNESVSDALVETGNEDVINTLLENPNASLSKGTMEYLVDQSERVDTYQNPLVRRPDLDADLAKRMYWWVSAALRQHIVQNFDIDEAELDDSIEASVHDAIAKSNADSKDSKTEKLVERLAKAGDITPAFLVQTLRQGEIALFETAFAKLAKLSMTLTRRILYEQGGEALSIACKAIAIDKPTFATIFLLSRKARPGDKAVDPSEVSRVMTFFERVKVDAAKNVVKRWQLDPNYQQAIAAIEPTTKTDAGS